MNPAGSDDAVSDPIDRGEADMEEPVDVASGPGAAARRRSLGSMVTAHGRSALVLPIVLIIGSSLLVTAGISGTSVGSLYDAPGAWATDSSLVVGRLRSIRSDEYALWTPNIVANARRGFPVERQMGLTRAYLPASSISAPSRHWSEFFKPHDWPLLIGAPLQHAFAARWWLLLIIGMIGVYALLLILTRSVMVASGFTLLATLTPASAWWTNQPAPIIGSMAGAAALVLVALRVERHRTAILLGMGSGYCLVMGVFLMYPPWALTAAIPCAALVIGQALDHRARLRRLLVTGAGVIGVVVPVLITWYLQGRAAIDATRATIYPGQRHEHGGGANLAWLFDAPLSWLFTNGSVRGVTGTMRSVAGDPLIVNESELSSAWMPVPLAMLVGLAVFLAWRRNGARQPHAPAPVDGTFEPPAIPLWTTVALLAVLALYLAWALLPVPDAVGSLTLLANVPGRRMVVGLGWVCVLTLAVGFRSSTMFRRSRHSIAAVTCASLLWAGTMVAAVASFDLEGSVSVFGWAIVVIVSLVISLGTGLALLGRRFAWTAMAAGLMSAALYAPVNPLYRGLGPLENDPLVIALQPMVKGRESPITVVFGEQITNALVTASGVTNLSGITPYPDRAFWMQWAPDQETLWNKYANYWWVPDTALGGDGVMIERLAGTITALRVNPCSPFMRALEVTLVVSETRLSAACLTDERRIERPAGKSSVYLYQRKGDP